MTDIVVDVGEFAMMGRAESERRAVCLQAVVELTEEDSGWSKIIAQAVKWLVRYTGASHVKIRAPLMSSNWATAKWPEAEEAWANCPGIQKQAPRQHLIVCPIHVRIGCPCYTETKSGYVYAYRANVEPGKGGDQFFTTDAQFVKAVAQIISLQLQTEGNRVAIG